MLDANEHPAGSKKLVIAKIRNRVKDLSDKEKLDIRKTKDDMVYLLAFAVTVMMVIKSVAILKGIFKEEKDFT